MVSDPGSGVGNEQVHLDDPDLQPFQLRQARPVRQDPLTEFRSPVSELSEPRKKVLVFHGEVGPTTRLGGSSARHAHRDHSFDVRIIGILEKLPS
jgi:hypothetical protein